MQDWDHEKILRFINLYMEKPELWNSKDNKYHLKNAKNDAWESIAEKLQCDTNTAKNKMTSLLSSFRREKGKMKKSIGTGKGREEIYTSKWFAFNSFAFLMDKDKPGNTVDTENNLDSEDDSVPKIYTDDESVEIQSESEDVVALKDNLQTETTQVEMEPAKPKKIFNSPKKPLKRKRVQEDLRVDYAFNVLKNIKENPKDECTTYGEHIANKLRKFDNHLRAIVMHHINNVIFDAEMGRHNTFMYNQQPNIGTRLNQTSPHFSQNSPSSSLHSSNNSYVENFQDSPSPLQDFVQTFTDPN